MKKNTLSILGLGSRSTLFYLAELNTLYLQKKGGYSTCPFTLLNTNFDEINSYTLDLYLGQKENKNCIKHKIGLFGFSV